MPDSTIIVALAASLLGGGLEAPQLCVEERIATSTICPTCTGPDRVRATEADGVRHVVYSVTAIPPVLYFLHEEGDGTWTPTILPLTSASGSATIVSDMAVQGDLLAVAQTTQVDLFRLSDQSWVLEQTIVNPSFPVGPRSVALSVGPDGKERVAIGAGSNVSPGPGTAAVYRRGDTEWTLEQLFTPPEDPDNPDPPDLDDIKWFGSSVAMHGARLVIAGASEPLYGQSPGGAASYVLIDGVWTLDSLIKPPNWLVAPFGLRMVLHGDTLVVRSQPSVFSEGSSVLTVWVRGDGGWALTDLADPGEAGQTVGSDLVAIADGDDVLVAAGVADSTYAIAGARLLRIRDGLVVDDARLPNPSFIGVDVVSPYVGLVATAKAVPAWVALIAPGDPLGRSVRILSPTAEDCDGDGIADACALADMPTLDCDHDGVIDACQIASGVVADANGDGVPDTCQPPACDELPVAALVTDQASIVRFGDAVAVDGDTLAIMENDGFVPGSQGVPQIRLFDRIDDVWVPRQVLVPEPAAAGALALDGDVLVSSWFEGPGVPNDNTKVVAYVRSNDVWGDPVPLGFGRRAVISGDRVAYLGAETSGGAAKLRVHRFMGGAWTLEQEIVAPTGSQSLVALDGDWLAARMGSFITLYQRTGDPPTWSFSQSLTPPLPLLFDSWADSIALSGDWLAVGTANHFDPVEGTGCVDLFRRVEGTWAFHRRILAIDPFDHASLGTTLAMRLPWLVVGAPLDDFGADNAGTAWLLRLDKAGTDFHPVRRLTRQPLGSLVLGENHGDAVAISGTAEEAVVVVGAPLSTTPEAPGSGVVREYRVSVIDCDGSGFDDACEASLGFLPDADGDGVPDACDDPADLDGDGAVGSGDLGELLAQWGGPGTADLDGDGVVGSADLGLLLAGWTG